ncbi:unnamed protein product [Toxocara canis]|uniref:Transmembrane protein n=1 Tax=Toxocara canis TaxID=6265 RepID=A0A183UM23_TOXCA|nr:unnamed protein product [Toxocara canis]
MEPNRVFRLTRTSLHQLTDLSKYATSPLSSSALKMTSEQPVDNNDCEFVAVNARTSRPVIRFNPTLRWREGETRHHSLVSMRTFYAFGARSASVSSPSSYRILQRIAAHHITSVVLFVVAQIFSFSSKFYNDLLIDLAVLLIAFPRTKRRISFSVVIPVCSTDFLHSPLVDFIVNLRLQSLHKQIAPASGPFATFDHMQLASKLFEAIN